MGLIPGRGTKIPHAAWPKKKKKERKWGQSRGRGRAIHRCWAHLGSIFRAGGLSPQGSSSGGPVLIAEVQVYPLLLSSSNLLRQTGQDRSQSCTPWAQLLCLSQALEKMLQVWVGLRVCRSHSAHGCPDFWSGFEGHTLSGWAGEIPGAPGSLPEGPTAGGTVTQLPCVRKPSSRMCVYVCACACARVCTRAQSSLHLRM